MRHSSVPGDCTTSTLFKWGNEFLVNTTTIDDQKSSSITGLAGGGFVVAWRDDSRTGADVSFFAVRAQVFDSDGNKSGDEFLVNTTTLDRQNSPDLTALADGRFVAAWEDSSNNGGDLELSAVRAQVFNADGSKSGTEFLVNSTTADAQDDATDTALADGRFVVAFTDESESGSDISGRAVRGQIFDPRVTAVTLNGSTLDDDFVGTGHGDTMRGFLGDDMITGGAGDDMIEGEQGNDTLLGNAGFDIMYGGAGNDLLRGGGGTDRLFGGEGDDLLKGGFDVDYMEGGAGDDTYVVALEADIIVEASASGTDTVKSGRVDLKLNNIANVENASLFGASDLSVFGDGGGNILNGNKGANLLKGWGGQDILRGSDGNDTLLGGSGADQLYGGNGADKLAGNIGDDALTGGTGADTFQFETGSGSDTIRDYEDGVDKIEILSGATGFGELTLTQSGAHVRVAFSDTDFLVKNVTVGDLDASDFIF